MQIYSADIKKTPEVFNNGGFIIFKSKGKGLHSHSIDLLINKYINFEKGHCKDIVKDPLIVLKSKANNIEHDPMPIYY